ncbi:hypothetical protein [Amphiplicatus metriothermophilus]|uniref:Uncharacterized protein n=1 Tax=Amphiplicatus metriothermophilus TaxID=1519374 RepID=A0A239PTI1_9PROT|nr:hypothetical protein [Amphiplicatus metriothermophilus]MBB5519264.1 hypothetical protein [Amphiplicatus metriothermophilus]SNT73333.1 hypothetical protein SAMN06297382_1731 [Amphiplicatus metriothermophilus]
MTQRTLLKYALLADAAASGATGLFMAGGAGLLAPLLGLPKPLLLYAGLFLIPYAVIVALVGVASPVRTGAVCGIVLANLVWTAASFGLFALPQIAPTLLGYAFVAAQALAVLAFALVQRAGLARLRAQGA